MLRKSLKSIKNKYSVRCKIDFTKGEFITVKYENNHRKLGAGYAKDVCREIYKCKFNHVFEVVSLCDGTDLDNHLVWEVNEREIAKYRMGSSLLKERIKRARTNEEVQTYRAALRFYEEKR